MIVCPRCGAQQPDGATTCAVCGAALAPPPPAEQHAPTLIAPRCPQCGAALPPDALFCEQCGAPVAEPKKPVPPPIEAGPVTGGGAGVCPHCGAELVPGSRFCDQCGEPVGIPATPPRPPEQPPAAPPSAPPSSAPPPTPTAAVKPAGGYVTGRLVVKTSGLVLPIPPGKNEVIIGREDPISGIFPDIDLTDHGGDRGGVSRRHARLFVREGVLLIEDLNSKNHTYVNGLRLTPGVPHPLGDGDEIRLGRVKLDYYAR